MPSKALNMKYSNARIGHKFEPGKLVPDFHKSAPLLILLLFLLVCVFRYIYVKQMLAQ